MKRWSIIWTIIVLIIVWIRWFLEIDHVRDDPIEEIIINQPEEESIEPENQTWEIAEEESYINEETEKKEDPIVQQLEEPIAHQQEQEIIIEDKNYPIYWVIETDNSEEWILEDDIDDSDLQETEKILMQALQEWSEENEQTGDDENL